MVAVAGVLSFVAMLDMNIVTVAVPHISRALDVTPEVGQWALLGYQVPVVALLLPVGQWLKSSGMRPALLVSVVAFGTCSVAAALSPTMSWLIIARVLQGGFGAVLFVLMPTLAARAVRPERRGRAMSVPATLGPLGAVTGPALGGVLLDHLGWQAIFLVKVPLCAAAAVIAWRVMPRDGRPARPDRHTVINAVLVATAVASLLLALTLAPAAPAWLSLGLVAVLAATYWLRHPTAQPVLAVLRTARTTAVNLAVLLVACAFMIMHYLVSLHLQRDDGVSASTTGLTMLAFPLAMGLAGPVGGRLADLWGSRRIATIGAAFTTAGLLLLVPISGSWSPVDVVWRLALAGLGMGLYGGPTQALVMTAAPADRMALAGAAVQLSRSLGFTLGPALGTAVWGLAGGGDAGTKAGIGLAVIAGAGAVLLLAKPWLARSVVRPVLPSDSAIRRT
ncbi:MAG: MFS transporter [Kutzneria sp.]|nr:MFS transporter [Kutzneria sp.]